MELWLWTVCARSGTRIGRRERAQRAFEKVTNPTTRQGLAYLANDLKDERFSHLMTRAGERETCDLTHARRRVAQLRAVWPAAALVEQ